MPLTHRAVENLEESEKTPRVVLELTITEVKIRNWGIHLCERRLSRRLTEGEILRRAKPRPALGREQPAAEGSWGLTAWQAGREVELPGAETKGNCLRKALRGLRRVKPFGDIAKITRHYWPN